MVNLYTKMKKAAGAVLAVAMGMSCIPAPLAVYAQQPEEYTVVLEEDFESELGAGIKLSGEVSVVEVEETACWNSRIPAKAKPVRQTSKSASRPERSWWSTSCMWFPTRKIHHRPDGGLQGGERQQQHLQRRGVFAV